MSPAWLGLCTRWPPAWPVFVGHLPPSISAQNTTPALALAPCCVPGSWRSSWGRRPAFAFGNLRAEVGGGHCPVLSSTLTGRGGRIGGVLPDFDLTHSLLRDLCPLSLHLGPPCLSETVSQHRLLSASHRQLWRSCSVLLNPQCLEQGQQLLHACTHMRMNIPRQWREEARGCSKRTSRSVETQAWAQLRTQGLVEGQWGTLAACPLSGHP